MTIYLVAANKINKISEIFQALRDLFSEAVEKGQSLIRHRILGTFYVWPLDGKTVSVRSLFLEIRVLRWFFLSL